MKKNLLVLGLLAAIVAASGCARSQNVDTKTAMQKKYGSQSDCAREFPQAGDCTRYTTSGGGSYFMSPLFYPWGGIMHSNGMMGYDQRVPTSGYVAAGPSQQRLIASRTNFNRVPASYVAARSNATRGGFGGSARTASSSSSRSSGG